MLDCVRSVQQCTDDFECVVVDNASIDRSIEDLQTGFPNVRVIRNSANYGFAKANNIGISNAKGKFIVLLNSDTIVTNKWLDELIRCIEADPRIGIATPKLLRLDGRLDSTGHIFWFDDVEGKNRGEDELDLKQYDNETELLTCDFRCAIIKRDTFDHVGHLDDMIFFYHEDIDFCIRAQIAGWRVLYCPKSVVYHHRGGSTSTNQMTILQRRRQRYLLRIALKSYQRRSAVIAFVHKLRQFMTRIIKVIAGLKNGDFAYSRLKLAEAISFPEGMIWNAVHPPVKVRIIVQARRKVADDELRQLSLRSARDLN